MGPSMIRSAAVMLAVLAVPAIAQTNAAPPAVGSGLSVAPVQLSLTDATRSVSTQVSNPGDAPVTVQARLYSWTMRGEEEVYAPASDMGFSPPLFRLEARRTQAIRVIMKSAPGPTERAYRLVIDQLPIADAPGQLQLPVRLVLPVFAEPAVGTVRASHLKWSARFDAPAKQVRISVANSGTVHAKIIELAVDDAGKHAVLAGGLAGYALAGQSRTWSYPSNTAPLSLTITARHEAETLRITVPVAQ